MGEVDRREIVEKIRQRIAHEAFRDPIQRERFQQYLTIVGPLLHELAELGYEIDTLDDLLHQSKPYKTALPVLLRWLPKIEEPSVKESIVRCLSVPWVRNKATAELIEEFKKYAPIDPQHSIDLSDLSSKQKIKYLTTVKKPCDSSASLAWAIGNALSIVDVKGFERQIIDLCRNRKYAMARQMLVLGLGRFRSPEAEEVAIELLNDEDVLGANQESSTQSSFALFKSNRCRSVVLPQSCLRFRGKENYHHPRRRACIRLRMNH